MASAHEEWKANLTQKIANIRELLLKYLVNRQDTTLKEIRKELAGTKIMFSEKRLPAALRELEANLNVFSANAANQNSFLELIHYYQTLPSIVAFDDVEPPSFDSIFQSYKDDNELNTLVDELIKTLEKILAEADETLSAQISRELEAILKQIKKNRRKSLYELLPWIDFGMKGLLVVAEMHTGIKGLDWVYEGIKLSLQINRRAMDLHKESGGRLLKEHNLKFIEKAAERFPENTADDAAQKLLNPSEKAQ
jgi:hypothetical protein